MCLYVNLYNTQPKFNRGVFRTTGGSSRGLSLSSAVDYIAFNGTVDDTSSNEVKPDFEEVKEEKKDEE